MTSPLQWSYFARHGVDQTTEGCAEPGLKAHVRATTEAEKCLVDISHLHQDCLRGRRSLSAHLASLLRGWEWIRQWPFLIPCLATIALMGGVIGIPGHISVGTIVSQAPVSAVSSTSYHSSSGAVIGQRLALVDGA